MSFNHTFVFPLEQRRDDSLQYRFGIYVVTEQVDETVESLLGHLVRTGFGFSVGGERLMAVSVYV